MIDDTSAVSQINHIGPCHSEEYNSLVVQITYRGSQRPIFLVPPMWLQMVKLGIFIPTTLNGCLTLNCWPGPSRPIIFNQRLTYLLLVYVSNCLFFAHLDQTLRLIRNYCFPPAFSCISQVLQKIIQELLDLKCTFVITERVQQSRVGTHLQLVDFFWYIQRMRSYMLLNNLGIR